MKRKYTSAVLLIALVLYPFTRGFSQNQDNPKLTVSVNPMGILFFGPSINLGWVMDEKTVINFNIRRNSWGLLARSIRSSDPTLNSFKGMGYAVGFTRFVKSVEEGIYYGAFLSLDIQNTKYQENSPFRWHEKTKSFGLLGNAGKRFKIGSHYYLNAGGSFGWAFVRYHWEYDNVSLGLSDPEPRKGGSNQPIGSLELAFGRFID